MNGLADLAKTSIGPAVFQSCSYICENVNGAPPSQNGSSCVEQCYSNPESFVNQYLKKPIAPNDLITDPNTCPLYTYMQFNGPSITNDPQAYKNLADPQYKEQFQKTMDLCNRSVEYYKSKNLFRYSECQPPAGEQYIDFSKSWDPYTIRPFTNPELFDEIQKCDLNMYDYPKPTFTISNIGMRSFVVNYKEAIWSSTFAQNPGQSENTPRGYLIHVDQQTTAVPFKRTSFFVPTSTLYMADQWIPQTIHLPQDGFISSEFSVYMQTLAKDYTLSGLVVPNNYPSNHLSFSNIGIPNLGMIPLQAIYCGKDQEGLSNLAVQFSLDSHWKIPVEAIEWFELNFYDTVENRYILPVGIQKRMQDMDTVVKTLSAGKGDTCIVIGSGIPSYPTFTISVPTINVGFGRTIKATVWAVSRTISGLVQKSQLPATFDFTMPVDPSRPPEIPLAQVKNTTPTSAQVAIIFQNLFGWSIKNIEYVLQPFDKTPPIQKTIGINPNSSYIEIPIQDLPSGKGYWVAARLLDSTTIPGTIIASDWSVPIIVSTLGVASPKTLTDTVFSSTPQTGFQIIGTQNDYTLVNQYYLVAQEIGQGSDPWPVIMFAIPRKDSSTIQSAYFEWLDNNPSTNAARARVTIVPPKDTSVQSLNWGKTYNFSLYALNDTSASLPTIKDRYQICWPGKKAPFPVAQPTINAIIPNPPSFTIQFTYPDPGSSPITSFIIKAELQPKSIDFMYEYIVTAKLKVGDTIMFTPTADSQIGSTLGLFPSSTYNVYVQSISLDGASDWSAPITVQTLSVKNYGKDCFTCLSTDCKGKSSTECISLCKSKCAMDQTNPPNYPDSLDCTIVGAADQVIANLKSCKDPAFSSIPKGATILGVKNLDSHTRQVFYRNQKTFTVDDKKNTCELNPGQYLYEENGPGWDPPKAIEMVNKNDWIRDYWWIFIVVMFGLVILTVVIMGLMKIKRQ